MKKYISNNKILVGIAAFLVLVGIIQSLILKDFIWFSRSGSLIVAIGIILLSRTFIIGKDILLSIENADTSENLNSPEYFLERNIEVLDYVKNDILSRIAIGRLGPIVSSIGTIVWGYGDLLNFFIK